MILGRTLSFFLGLQSCNLLPPEIQLAVEITDYNYDMDDTVIIEYTMTNVGDTDLTNCKVQFGIDEVFGDVGGVWIYYDEITDWDPNPGVDLAQGESYSGVLNSLEAYPLDVDYVGVYAVGFDNPKDEE